MDEKRIIQAAKAKNVKRESDHYQQARQALVRWHKKVRASERDYDLAIGKLYAAKETKKAIELENISKEITRLTKKAYFLVV